MSISTANLQLMLRHPADRLLCKYPPSITAGIKINSSIWYNTSILPCAYIHTQHSQSSVWLPLKPMRKLLSFPGIRKVGKRTVFQLILQLSHCNMICYFPNTQDGSLRTAALQGPFTLGSTALEDAVLLFVASYHSCTSNIQRRSQTGFWQQN